MTIDMPKEPTIPDPLLGVSPREEILGDPCGGTGGGGGKRMLDWSRGRNTRRNEERRKLREWSGGRNSRRKEERGQMRVETRSKERLEPTFPDIPQGQGVSCRAQGSPHPRGDVGWLGSVAQRRIRDSHWRRTGEWTEDAEMLEIGNNKKDSSGLKVPRPMAQAESSEPLWRPWMDVGHNNTQNLSQTVSELRTSVTGSHKDVGTRSIPFEECPSSNLHHFVKPEPHTSHEVYPSLDIRTKKSIFDGKSKK